MHKNMSKLLTIIMLLAAPALCLGDEMPDWLIGVWQSNEKMTLDDMNNNHEVSQKAHQVFDHDFFGKLIQVVRKNESASYFVDEKPKNIKFEKYKKVIVKENSVTFIQYSEVINDDMESTIYKEGECFYMLVSKWQFKECFWPVR